LGRREGGSPATTNGGDDNRRRQDQPHKFSVEAFFLGALILDDVAFYPNVVYSYLYIGRIWVIKQKKIW
jgi:hypothetical protein